VKQYVAGGSLLLSTVPAYDVFREGHGIEVPPQYCSKRWIPGTLSSGVKRPGHESDHSPPCSSEVKNGRTIPPRRHTASWRGA
jgi:hypothetical protein